MTVVAHISDIHFGREVPEVVAALIADLAEVRPDVVVISGDLTQSASHRQFAAARTFLDRLPAPCLVVPGNHDIVSFPLWELFLAPYRRWRRFVTTGLAPEWSNAALLIKGVNSARPFGPYLNWSRGMLSPAQIAAVTAAGRDPRVLMVAAHHPVAHGNDVERDYDLVTRSGELLATLAARPRSLVLLGHRHRSHVSLWSPTNGERPASSASTLAPDDVLVVHAGTATSDRLRGEVNSWNRITLTEGGVGIEVRHYAGDRWVSASHLTLSWPDRAAAGATGP